MFFATGLLPPDDFDATNGFVGGFALLIGALTLLLAAGLAVTAVLTGVADNLAGGDFFTGVIVFDWGFDTAADAAGLELVVTVFFCVKVTLVSFLEVAGALYTLGLVLLTLPSPALLLKPNGLLAV